MKGWAHRLLVLAVTAIGWIAVASGGAGTAAAHAKTPPTYHSPGYTGTSKPVATAPAPTLPPVVVGSGNDPSVVVDAAGTAHIAWTTDDGDQADGLHYCRLPRGATSCDSTTVLRPEPTNAADYDPSYNIESGGPQLYVLGSQLVMVAHRESTSDFSHPDGSLGGTTLVYVSQDGGSTWSPVNGVPQYGIVGTSDIGGPGVAYGTDTDPKIGVISSLNSDGTSFQELSPGAFTSQSALIGPGLAEGSAGSLALNGNNPIAAFHGPANDTLDVRAFTGNGTPNDVTNWGAPVQFPGSDPQLTSGPSGIYLIDSELKYSQLSVHKLTVTPPAVSPSDPTITEGPGTAISEDEASDPYLTEGPDGTVYAAWSGTAGLRLNSAKGGTTWASAQGTTIDSTQAALNETQLAVAADGGGFAVVHQGAGTSTESKIVAVPFGTQAKTGQPGLGNLPGGQGDIGVSEGCQTVTFGPVKAQVDTGCFLKGANGAVNDEVSDGAVTVNGVTITPDPSAGSAIRPGHAVPAPVQIIVNAHAGTIDSTGAVTVAMAGASPAIVLWHGAIHLDLHGAKVGDTLFDFPPQGHSIDGFSDAGDIIVNIAAGYGVSVPLAADLPAWAAGFTAGATLTSDADGGLNQASLELKIADMPLGVLELKDIDIRYDPLADDWSGQATLDVPEGEALFSAKLMVTFKDGELTQAAFETEIPPPGIPVYPDIYIHEFQGSFATNPFSFSIGGRVGLYDGDGFPIDLLGTLNARFGPPDVFSLDGELDVFGVSIGTASTTITFDPFSFRVQAQLDLLGLVSGMGNIEIDPPHFSGSASVTVLGYDVSDAYVSDHAIAGCTSVPLAVKTLYVGLDYHWGGSLTPIFTTNKKSCDFPVDEQAPVGADLARARLAGPGAVAPAGGATFSVAPGTAVEDVSLRTASGTPAVTLLDPSGETVTPVVITRSSTTPPSADSALSIGIAGQSVVMLPHPAAGTWTVLPAAGAPALTGVDTARGYDPPVLHASLIHTGTHLAIKYSLTRRAGASVSFVEHGRGVNRTVRTVTGGQGTITFTPTLGPGGRRSIEALVQDRGEPLSRPVIGSFTAPALVRPPAPELRVVLRGHSFRVSVFAPASVQRVLLRARLSDGRRLAYSLGGGSRTLTIPVRGYTDTLGVSATATSALGTVSRTGAASGHYPARTRPKAKRHTQAVR